MIKCIAGVEMWRSGSVPAVLIFSMVHLCHAHMNQAHQAYGPQGGQMVQQGVHPASGYGAGQPQMGHQMQPQVGQHPPNGGNMLRDKAQIQDRAHIQEHLQEILG